MTDLSDEEKRAVEKACAWDRNVRATLTPSEQRLVTGVKAQMVGRDIKAQIVVGGCAIGYLQGDRDGYRRGVEAALHEAMMADSETEARREIRALLAQEESRG